MEVGLLPPGELGNAASLFLPRAAGALVAGEPLAALALAEGSTAVGALAGYLQDGIFQIISLYVAPGYRRESGGRLLLEQLAEMLEGYASGMEISFTVTQEEHGTLPLFLEAMGFQAGESNGDTIYLTTLDAILRGSFFKGGGMGMPFSEIDAGILKAASKEAAVSGAPVPEGGLDARAVDQEVSVAVVENGRVQAYAAFTIWEGGLALAALWSSSATLLPGLLNAAASRLRGKYPSNTRLAVQAVNDASAALVPVLMPEAKPISYTYHYPFH